MPKDDAALKAQGEAIEAILQDGKKKELNFVLMKSKGGVVLKAGPSVKGFPKLKAECKSEGGMPAFCACGMLTVSGRTMNMTQVEEEPVEPAVMRKLAGQAKKHFKALGIRPAKMIMTLPNGDVIDSDSVEDEGDEEEGDEDKAPESVPEVGDQVLVKEEDGKESEGEEDQDDALKQQLADRLKALVPQVRDAVAKAVAGADKLGAGLKAAGTELANGAFDKVAKLLDAVEKGLKQPSTGGGGDAPQVDPGALREKLVSEFSGITGDLRKVIEQGEKAVAGKAQQFAQMFKTELDGDLKKAGSILTALKRFVETEIGKLAPPTPVGGGGDKVPTEGLFDDIVGGVTNLVGEIGDKIGETVDKVVDTVTEIGTKVVEGVQDTFNDLTATPEERSARGLADALGLSREEREKLIEKMKTDPKAAETLAKDRMKSSGVPDGRQAELIKMAMHDPKAFAAALGSLASMDKGGAVDISADAMQKSMEALEKAHQDNEAKQKAAADTLKKLNDSMKAYGEAGKAVTDARGKADVAAKAIEELKQRIGDPSKLSNEQKLKFAEESRALINANEKAKADLAKAIEAEKKASMDYADASDKNGKAQEAADKTKEKLGEAQATQDAKDGKKSLIDAMSFGPLSPTGKMSDEDKAKFAGAYGKNAKVADGMLAMVGTAKNPSALAANAGFLADTAAGGFAGPDGSKLDLPKGQLDQMALNAARMGDEAGGDYFKNFDAYLKSGKQLDPDPTGGMDGPLSDPKEEEKRKNKVSLARTQAMGSAAVKDDGTVDFNSDAAKGQMDHMMFHPGSLKTFTPQMNMKMAETKGLFDNPATKDKANETIKNTKLPGDTAPGKNAARTLIAGTTGKDKGTLTDNDAKASVLGAMMTPLSQGPVGSCFSTAPVRAIRETDPLRAMDEYSKIATTGQFKTKTGDVYPANTHLPEGENPLMRSFEYSVATAAADVAAAEERRLLNKGLMGGGANGLAGIKGIVGNDKWQDKADPLSGDIVPGIESKLKAAIKSQLTYEYNAGPQVGGPGGGGGDGHSTDGAYEVMYKGKAVLSQNDFVAAIQEIALGAAGETATTPNGIAIVNLVTAPAFITEVEKAYTAPEKYTPWKLVSGGFEDQTKNVLDGGAPAINDFIGAAPTTPPIPTEGQRTKAVLSQILNTQTGMTDKMGLVSTRGKNANHAFNTLPQDPSVAKVAPPGQDAKIDSELVVPGQQIAAKKMPAEQAAKLYDEQLKAQLDGKTDTERDLIVAALKKKPTTEMTNAELQAKITTELQAMRDMVAARRADAFFKEDNAKKKAKGEVEWTEAQRTGFLLNWFKTNTEDAIKADLVNKIMKDAPPPQVVVADSNWGGPEGQTFFVAAPDPVSGELKMWKKEMPGGKMTPLGKNWGESKWAVIN